MMDPMANLDGGAAPGAATDASSTTKDVFDPNALNFNLKNIDKIRSFMGIVSGCVAGILGITGILPGFGESIADGVCCCVQREEQSFLTHGRFLPSSLQQPVFCHCI